MSMHVNAELALLKSTRPEINGLEDIVGDILQDDRRATKVLRRVRSPSRRRLLVAARCFGSRFLLRDRQLTIVSFEGDATSAVVKGFGCRPNE
jgi:hypothetical protein